MSDMIGESNMEEEDDDVEDSLSEEDFEDDDENMEKSENLINLVKSISHKKADKNARKSVSFDVNNEKTEIYDESEFRVSSRRNESESEKSGLTLSDLLGSVQASDKFGSLKQRLERLDSNGGRDAGAVAAPLPRRTQEKLNREAARTIANKEANKWAPLVQKNRRVTIFKYCIRRF